MKLFKEKWKLAVDAYSSSGGFDNKDYLQQYTREDDEKFKERKKTAYYENIFKQKVERYVGYLFRKKPARTTTNKLISLIFDDVDRKGNSIDVFMSNFASEAKVRGSMLLLVDMPKTLPPTLKEQQEQKAIPYFVPIAPERVEKYKIDKFGKFKWILFTDTEDNSTLEDESIRQIYRYYDKENWIIYDKDIETILEQGKHNLGVCPVLAFTESGEFPAIGEFTQIGEISKRLLNLNSELDEILRGQTFSILTIQARSPKDVTLNVGTDNALSYPAGMERPSFIAPPVAPAQTYENRIEKLESRINEIAYDINTTKSAESGISLEIKFQGLNSSLSKFAQRLNDLELRAFDVAFKYLGTNFDLTITYPTDFNIVDTSKEIETLDSLKSLGYTIPTYEKEKLKRIVSNDLGTLTDEAIAKINAEIEDSLKEVD
jgi:hypothetical protein